MRYGCKQGFGPKSSYDYNRTFKVELKVMEHMCLATTANREEWL